VPFPEALPTALTHHEPVVVVTTSCYFG